MKRYFFRVSSKGKSGCRVYTDWRYTDTCKTKAEVRKRFGGYGKTVQIIEEEPEGKVYCWD